MDTSQYMSIFLEETIENLRYLNDSLLLLESCPEDISKLNEIFRIAHTIKGMAATMGFNKMTALTHKMEDVLSRFRVGELKADQRIVTVLFRCLDTLENMAARIGEGLDDDVAVEELLTALDSVSEYEENEDVYTGKVTVENGHIPVKPEMYKKHHHSVRVDFEHLDVIMRRVSELVICRTKLEQINSLYKLREIEETLEELERATSDLQELVKKIRMLPLDVIMGVFPRMVRDLSLELGKEIQLTIEGENTELDRALIEEIGEPLVHIIRNAVDHGIEAPGERMLNGKTTTGRISIKAWQEGTNAAIRIEDDGRGISLKRIKEKAVEQGYEINAMSDDEILNLIFVQGFSTSTSVTDISGRGVGMDVVKTKISELGGMLKVESEEGKGTSIVIRLPLTLQIIHALFFKTGSEILALSIVCIDRVIEYNGSMISVENGLEMLNMDNNSIPLIRLCDRLGLEDEGNKKKYIIIVKAEGKTTGVVVDSLIGQKEIVIKPLGKTLSGLKEYIGATILGDGLVTLILDVAALV
ncbi:MAG: chemotaxis protein CheA [Clostridiaceae bacterium]